MAVSCQQHTHSVFLRAVIRLLDDGSSAALHCQNTRQAKNDILFNITACFTLHAVSKLKHTFGEVQPLSLPVSFTPMYFGACGSRFSDAGWLSYDLKKEFSGLNFKELAGLEP